MLLYYKLGVSRVFVSCMSPWFLCQILVTMPQIILHFSNWSPSHSLKVQKWVYIVPFLFFPSTLWNYCKNLHKFTVFQSISAIISIYHHIFLLKRFSIKCINFLHLWNNLFILYNPRMKHFLSEIFLQLPPIFYPPALLVTLEPYFNISQLFSFDVIM